MAALLTLPSGYRIERSRSGYALHSDYFGEIGEGDFGCWASACSAAHDHRDEMADGGDPDGADAAWSAYNALLDGFHALASQHLAQPIDDAETRGQHRAARAILAALDAIGTAACEDRRAA